MRNSWVSPAIWSLIATGILALSCTAESDGSKQAIETSSTAGLEEKTVATPRPATLKTGGDSKLPADAPAYPGARIEETGPGPDNRIQQVSISTAPAKSVYEAMAEQLEKQGWTIHSRMSDKGQFALDASKGTRRAAVLIADGKIVKGAGTPDTRITVLVAP